MSAALLYPHAVSLLKHGASRLHKRSDSPVVSTYHPLFAGNDPLDGAPPDVGPAMMTVLALLFVAVVVALSLLHYTIGLLLTLAIVEDPPAVYLPLANDPTIDVSTNKRAATQRKFITASVRGTLAHLRAIGGPLAPWRGIAPTFALGILTGLIRGLLFGVLSSLTLPTEPASFLAALAAPLATARMNMVVTHIRLTAPSSVSWWRRVRAVPYAAARPTLPALFAHSAAVAVAGELMVLGARPAFDAQLRAILAVANLAWCVAVVLPLYVVLVRVQAGLLAAEAETVVEFDRGFGVQSEEEGDEGKVGLWATAKGVVASGAGRRVVVLLMKTVGLYALVACALVGAWMAVAVACGAKFGVGN